MIRIEYESGNDSGISTFRVHVNNKFVCRFEHDSTDGHDKCLKKAADAVAMDDWIEFEILRDIKGG